MIATAGLLNLEAFNFIETLREIRCRVMETQHNSKDLNVRMVNLHSSQAKSLISDVFVLTFTINHIRQFYCVPRQLHDSLHLSSVYPKKIKLKNNNKSLIQAHSWCDWQTVCLLQHRHRLNMSWRFLSFTLNNYFLMIHFLFFFFFFSDYRSGAADEVCQHPRYQW